MNIIITMRLMIISNKIWGRGNNEILLCKNQAPAVVPRDFKHGRNKIRNFNLFLNLNWSLVVDVTNTSLSLRN